MNLCLPLAEETSNNAHYSRLFLENIPLLDVRSPIEFQQGAFPLSVNLPLLSDKEREAVGTCYKRQGKTAAIQLGEALVSGAQKAQRLDAWISYCQQHPNGYLYCLRGGLRSHRVQQWLAEAKIDYPLISGGYKALRHMLLEVVERLSASPLLIIAGNTGCAKTTLIRELPFTLDLEGLAQHRGSSFGRTLDPQPTQVNFEHQVAIAALKKQHLGYQYCVIEDEGRMIGSRHLPPSLYAAMQHAPLVVIEAPFEQRVLRLQAEYINGMWQQFIQYYGEERGFAEYSDYLYQGLFTIRRRLGLARFQELSTLLKQALIDQQQRHSTDAHLAWLSPLLEEYYDPMYRYQLSKKSPRIVFRGDYSSVKTFVLSFFEKK